MPFAYSKLHGVPADRLLAAIDPILAAHGLEGVELIWKTDNRGWVLYVTVERAGEGASSDPGAGVTLDDCSELSRDLSAALDVDDLITAAYRLEVGTPGIERRLYTLPTSSVSRRSSQRSNCTSRRLASTHFAVTLPESKARNRVRRRYCSRKTAQRATCGVSISRISASPI